jgi:hypothetical protein
LLSHQVPEVPCQPIHLPLHSHQVLGALPHPPPRHTPPRALCRTVLDEEGTSASASSCTTVGGAEVGLTTGGVPGAREPEAPQAQTANQRLALLSPREPRRKWLGLVTCQEWSKMRASVAVNIRPSCS